MAEAETSGDGGTRLERALSIFLDWQDGSSKDSAEELIARHPELEEYLRPLLEEEQQQSEATDGERCLGDYRLGPELGRGGMGVVYEAWQQSLGRSVALKVLAPQLTHSPAMLARFRREATTAARLQHPGIAAVLDFGSQGDQHFLAMEQVRGMPLDRMLRALPQKEWKVLNGRRVHQVVADAITETRVGTKIPGTSSSPATEGPALSWSGGYVQTVASLGVAVADVLEFAHQNGVIHRDVKPSNILLCPDGRVVLTDFGLAREEGLPSLTVTGDFAGTPHYVSPEQAQAKASELDRRTDVFSLGTTLYELLTHTRPFDGDTSHQIIDRILSRDPVDPQKLNPGLAPDLAAVLLKALEKDPEKRYQSAGEFAADLRAFLEYRPVQARRPTPWSRAKRWLRREPLKAGLAAVVVVSAFLGGYVLTTQEATATGRKVMEQEEIDRLLAQGFTEVLMVDPKERDRSVFERVLEQDPGNPFAILGWSESNGAEDPEKVLAFIDRHRVPGRAERALQRLRLAYERQLDGVGSENARDALAELGDPTDGVDCFVAGVLRTPATLRSEAELATAAGYFRDAIFQARAPNFLYLMRLSHAASRSGDNATARSCALALEKHFPDLPATYIAAGVALLFEPEQALSRLNKALELKPGHQIATRNLALTLWRLRRMDEAIAVLDKGIELHPDDHSFHSIRSSVLVADGRFDDALSSSRRAVELKPELAQYHMSLATTLERTGDRDGARESLYEALRLQPRYARAHRSLLGLARVTQDTALAHKEHQRWAEALKKDADAWNTLADFRLNNDRVREALKPALRAVELSERRDAHYLLTLARVTDKVTDDEMEVEALLEELRAVLPKDEQERADLLKQVDAFDQERYR